MSSFSFSLALSMIAAMTLVAAVQVRADDATRSVAVTGTAVARVKPDVVVWTINLTHTDADLVAARRASDEETRNVLALREPLGIEPGDVQTGNLQIRKVYERDRSGNQGAFRHYSLHRVIVLRQREISRFDDVLQRLTAHPNVEVSYVLESSRYHELRRQTRRRAVQVARDKASDMTSLLGAKLGHVLAIDEISPTRNQWRGSPASNTAFFSGEPVQPDDLEGTFAPGSIEIRVSVDIRFAIESP